MNVLSLRWKTRNAGQNQQQRTFIDYIVDNTPMWAHLALDDYDLVGRLGWSHESDRIIHELLGDVESELPSKRVMLYVCPECGDIGCGAITINVTKTDQTVTWSDFVFENDCDPEIDPDIGYKTELPNVGPFTFDTSQAETTLGGHTRLA